MENLRAELRAAVRQGQIQQIQKLLEIVGLGEIDTETMSEEQAKLELLPDEFKFELLCIAVDYSRAKVLELLFAKGFDLDKGYENWSRGPLLHIAIYNGDNKICEVLLRNGALTENHRGWESMSALHCVSVAGNIKLLELMFKYGADINSLDDRGLTALDFAAKKGHTKMVNLLIDRGAIFHNERDGPLRLAARKGHKDTFSFLLNLLIRPSNELLTSCLHLAFESFNLDIVKEIIDRGIDIDTQLDFDGINMSLLHVAADEENDELVNYCLNRGANVNLLDSDNSSVLHKAVTRVSPGIIRELLKRGADISRKNEKGETPFYICVTKCHTGDVLERLELLLSYKSDINAIDNSGKTVFNVIVPCRQSEFIEFLIQWIVTSFFDVLDNYTHHFQAISARPGLVSFWNDCKKEMRAMKTSLIKNTAVRFSDVLNFQSSSQLVLYARNKNIVKAFSCENLTLKFPRYANKLRQTFLKGILRKNLIDKCSRLFGSMYDSTDKKLPELPLVFIDQMFEYLSDDDLVSLYKI